MDSISTAIMYQRGQRVLAGVNLMKSNLSEDYKMEEWKVLRVGTEADKGGVRDRRGVEKLL